MRLHVAAICYCNRHTTDGHVPAVAVTQLTPRFKRAALDELLVNHWHVNGNGEYVIRDYLQWNKSREQITEERERLHKMRSEAGKTGAASRWQT